VLKPRGLKIHQPQPRTTANKTPIQTAAKCGGETEQAARREQSIIRKAKKKNQPRDQKINPTIECCAQALDHDGVRNRANARNHSPRSRRRRGRAGADKPRTGGARVHLPKPQWRRGGTGAACTRPRGGLAGGGGGCDGGCRRRRARRLGRRLRWWKGRRESRFGVFSRFGLGVAVWGVPQCLQPFSPGGLHCRLAYILLPRSGGRRNGSGGVREFSLRKDHLRV
jgi:hypothetical protein